MEMTDGQVKPTASLLHLIYPPRTKNCIDSKFSQNINGIVSIPRGLRSAVVGSGAEVRAHSAKTAPKANAVLAVDIGMILEEFRRGLAIVPTTLSIMFSSARRRCFIAANSVQSAEVSIPSFLLPAFQSPARVAAFSTSSSCRSKIGSAPLSCPPEVAFRISEPPVQKAGARVSRTQQGATVEVEGPLGKMSMAIPAYMSIETDEAKRSHTLRILDQEDRKQREMWGK